jgi:hypothetical protein
MWIALPTFSRSICGSFLRNYEETSRTQKHSSVVTFSTTVLYEVVVKEIIAQKQEAALAAIRVHEL